MSILLYLAKNPANARFLDYLFKYFLIANHAEIIPRRIPETRRMAKNCKKLSP